MINRKTIAALLTTAVINSAVASSELNPADKEIQQVIETFRRSIIEKNSADFLGLFYSPSPQWLGVFDDKTLARKRQNGSKLTKVSPGSHLDFIEKIITNPEIVEEKFWDINILSDDNIASVNFKYSFHIGEYTQNWGDEAWHLVKTDTGWKINSVIYSANFNPESKSE